MKKIIKKVFVLFIAVAMLLCVVTACGDSDKSSQPDTGSTGPNGAGDNDAGRDEPSQKVTKLTIWMSPDETRFMQDSGLPEKFMSEKPYEVEIVTLPWDTLHDKLLAGMAGGDLPGISMAADHWIGELASLGAFQPLDDFREENGYTDDKFLPNAWEHFRIADGKVYGAPFYWEARVLFYRTDLFEKAGLTGVPATLDEFAEYGKQLSNGVDQFGIAHQEQWLDFHFFSWILYELGGDFFTDDYSKCALTEPEAIEALEYYKMLYDENIMPKAPEKRVDGFQGFVDGYYAMAESGSWWFANIANQAPEIQDKYDVAILPKGPTGIQYAHPNPWAIPANGTNTEGGFEWLKFMLTPENAVKYSMTSASLPTMLSAYEYPEISGNEIIMAQFEAAKIEGTSIHNVPNAEAISEVVWNMLADIRDDAASIQDAAASASKKIDEYLGS
jgi:ABC-type glycerol-3-phosphate transport system substrate-binding protein